MSDAAILVCPACQATLTPVTWKSIHLDVCSQGCHGIWFDYKELQAVESSDTLENLDAAFEGVFSKKPLKDTLNHNPDRICPRDKTLLERYEWNVGSGIVMDSCPDCHGIWLDAGELEGYAAYVKKFRQQPPEPPPEIAEKMAAIYHEARVRDRMYEDEATRQIVRWDIGLLDDLVRGLIKAVVP